MSMKALRSFVLLLCLAPLCLSAAMAHATQPVAKASATQTKAAAKPVRKQAANKAGQVASKTPGRGKAKPSGKVVRKKPLTKAVAKPLPKPKLDLSLPAAMVEELKPEVGDPVMRRKPLLPSMFPQKPVSDDSPFQLNGRLINNEMQLQLRNDSRHDVEGAAIDFEFRQ